MTILSRFSHIWHIQLDAWKKVGTSMKALQNDWECQTCSYAKLGNMIMCKFCSRWHHWECVKMTEEDDEWFCQMCENLNTSQCVNQRIKNYTIEYFINRVITCNNRHNWHFFVNFPNITNIAVKSCGIIQSPILPLFNGNILFLISIHVLQ